MTRGTAGALVLVAAYAGCAQPSSPPGGERDLVPPRVISVSPAHFDTLRDLRAPVRIEFDERLSNRLDGVADFQDAVIVSPATGDVRVERGRRSLEVSMAGGWQPGLVYRVVVLPVYRDLFGNQRTEAVELVFTTGAPIAPTAVAGFAEDRLTGEPVPGARIEAIRRVDSVVYVAVADTGGFFSLRHIPAGVYDVRAWQDRDRDRLMEFQEAQDTAVLPLGFQDTVVIPMALLPMDTTPARLLRADAVDSVRVRLTFDDHFEPAPAPAPGRGTLYLLPDSVPAGGGSLIHPSELDSLRAAERAVADSIRAVADSLAALRADSARAAGDTLAPPMPPDSLPRPDTVAPDPGRPAGGVRPAPPAAGVRRPAGQNPRAPVGRGDGGPPLPSRELILVLTDPMRPGASYVVEVAGVVNIRGVQGGGGVARFRMPAPADTTSP